jgi:deoxyribonuclease V
LPRLLHRWNLTPRQAIALQTKLAPRVERSGSAEHARWIAGLDAAFSPEGAFCVGVVVLWDAELQEVCEQQIAWRPARFPYVPGLLTFREAHALLAALRKMRSSPDVLMCD